MFYCHFPLERAVVIKSALVQRGIPSARMTTFGIGGNQPIVPHSDPKTAGKTGALNSCLYDNRIRTRSGQPGIRRPAYRLIKRFRREMRAFGVFFDSHLSSVADVKVIGFCSEHENQIGRFAGNDR